MAIKKTQVSIDEVMKHLDERFEGAKKIKNEIRSSIEYICWLRELLKDSKSVENRDISYRKNELEEKTYENICYLDYLYEIIEEYCKKYCISQTYIEDSFGVPVYRVFYEDFYFEICKINYLGVYVSVRKTENKQNAIDYKDIMEDKEPKEYKEKEKFIKEFQEQTRKSKEKAEKLGVDIEYLKEIVEDEFEF